MTKLMRKPRSHLAMAALAMATLALGGCAGRSEPPAAALTDDDDAFCRANNVAPGSDAYVACRKDRDVQRGNAVTRANRAQRDLGEMMLNNPENGMRR